MHSQIPPANQAGEEIAVQDANRQNFEWELTRSNWRFFYAMMQEQSPVPGSGRDGQGDTKKAGANPQV